MCAGPCIKEGDTVGAGYMDDYGAEHGGTDKDETACLARVKDIFDYCEWFIFPALTFISQFNKKYNIKS